MNHPTWSTGNATQDGEDTAAAIKAGTLTQAEAEDRYYYWAAESFYAGAGFQAAYDLAGAHRTWA